MPYWVKSVTLQDIKGYFGGITLHYKLPCITSLQSNNLKIFFKTP